MSSVYDEYQRKMYEMQHLQSMYAQSQFGPQQARMMQNAAAAKHETNDYRLLLLEDTP